MLSIKVSRCGLLAFLGWQNNGRCALVEELRARGLKVERLDGILCARA